jgi:hypothetical protein
MRLFLAVLGFLSALIAPPWVALVVIIILSVRWRAWEAPLIGLVMDFMWLPSGGFFSPLPLYTIAAIAIVWGLEPIRIRFLL